MKKEGNNKVKLIRNIVLVIIALILIALTLIFAKNFVKDENEGKIGFIINNKDVTQRLKKDIFIDEKGIIYLSKQDIANFFDEYIYIDEQNNQIITTYGTKVAVLSLKQNKMTVNGTSTNILNTVIEKDGTY